MLFLQSSTREGIMGRRMLRELQHMSPEDQREFDRWLKVNAVGGLILAIGMLAMALLGANSTRHADMAAAPDSSHVVPQQAAAHR
jgi:heme/copper-type cytochrome/quinol oxidase subunit 1